MLVGLLGLTASSLSQSGVRDPWLWPFASESIWNTPIGSSAEYVPAGLESGDEVIVDTNLLFKVPRGVPERPVYRNPSWENRCSGNLGQFPSVKRRSVPIPDDLIVPNNGGNNASAFLLSDGRTLVQINPLARCQPGGPVYGEITNDVDLYGPGIEGGHGGSGLSSIGGTIRLGELIGRDPIRHALKITLQARRYFSLNNDGTPGYRWPALRADGYARDVYRGRNPALEMGALLAVRPSETPEGLGIRTEVGRRIFQALQDYGAYVVDDAACHCHNITAEQGVNEEVKRMYGYGVQTTGGAFLEDINRIWRALHVVNNNAPTRIGGGGTPRRTPAPPLAR